MLQWEKISRPDAGLLVAVEDLTEGRAIVSVLQGAGLCNVSMVNDGRTALNLVHGRPIRVLVVSWDLPEIGGVDLIRTIRSDPPSADLPCLLIISSLEQESLTQTKELRLDGLLLRPFSPDTLLSKIERGMSGHGAARGFSQWETEGDRAAESGRAADALAAYGDALVEGRSRVANLQTEIALTLFKMGRTTEAVASLEEAVRADPGLARAQAALGHAYLENGRPEEARVALEAARALDPMRESIQVDLAEALLALDDDQRAESLLRNLLRENPANGFLFNRLGMALRKQGKFEQACVCYQRALALNDRDEHLHFNLGRCHYEAGRPDQAVWCIQHALAINPDLSSAKDLLQKIKSVSL